MSDSAMRLVRKSRDEALRLNHADIGADHLLLALISIGDNNAAKMLRTTGCNLDSLQTRVEHLTIQQHEIWDGIEFNPPFDLNTLSEEQIVQGTKPSMAKIGSAEDPSSRMIPLSDLAENVMKEAMNQAHRYSRTIADTEHVLLAILNQSESAEASELKACGVSSRDVERFIEDLYRSE
jgi:ATP-dependent Clp protease ATP-binding subunit ClpA